MQKINITNQNRDLIYNHNKHLWFEKESDNLYTIHTDLDYLLEFSCINYDELPEDADEYDFISTDQYGKQHKGRIVSFDPSGGPYISLNNYIIGNRPVVRIYQENGNTYFVTE